MTRSFTDQLASVQNPVALVSDLILVLLWVYLTVMGIFIPVLNESALRVVFALPTILFLPGYVLIAALFPRKEDLDAIERVALSFGLSIAVVPLIGLALNYTPWGIRLEPVLAALVFFIIVLAVISAIRRIMLSPDERFTVPFRRIAADAQRALMPPDSSRVDRVLNVILIASIVLAIGATVYVITVPKEGEKFTEFYILGAAGKAADYPRDLQVGGEYGVIIGIGNHEYRNVTYTVECHLMNMTFDPTTNTSSIQTMQELDHFSLTLPHNTTQEVPWRFTVPAGGFNRLEFLLFNRTAPGETLRMKDRINASYRDLHLWVEIR